MNLYRNFLTCQVREIKAAASAGNKESVKQMAKSMVRLRGQMAKLTTSEAHLRGVRTNLSVSAFPVVIQMNPKKIHSRNLQFAIVPSPAQGQIIAPQFREIHCICNHGKKLGA